ncbi:MAG TPA: Uma2 family endonuclease [Longimicrobiaceae bacterium]|jgi:Uma2 family endonuclease|nr:Uma2 family endonuclease [Longimicrobiaceae bacterium]
MATRADSLHSRISWEDFLATASEDVRAEWVDGEVVPMSPVSERHARITVFLTTLMNLLAQRRKLGTVLHAPFYMKTAQAGREPDILFIAAQNGGRIKPTFLDGPADLVVEVVSPESRTRDRDEKRREYERAGVREFWLIDPLVHSAELYRLADGGRFDVVPADAEGRLHSRVMEGFWLDAEWLWAEPLPDAWDVLAEWGLM